MILLYTLLACKGSLLEYSQHSMQMGHEIHSLHVVKCDVSVYSGVFNSYMSTL